MIIDPTNQFRTPLQESPPAFIDKVNTPWEPVPDLQAINKTGFEIIRGVLNQMRSRYSPERPAPSQGIVIQGEAGTGKTHLLMRIAHTLSKNNYILFVPKPNNAATLTLQVWAHVVSSLTRIVPERSPDYSQLDDMLAHVFSRVLIPLFEADDSSEQKRAWAQRLKADPFNIFRMLGTR